jgi:hypothetical protein
MITWLLMAGSDKPNVRAFREAFRGLDWEAAMLRDPRVIGAALVIAGLAMAGLVIWRRIRQDRRRHGPILRRACRELRLSWLQRHLLIAMARAGRVGSPVALLISRGCFDHAMAAYRARRPDLRPRMLAVRQTVFAGDPPPR